MIFREAKNLHLKTGILAWLNNVGEARERSHRGAWGRECLEGKVKQGKNQDYSRREALV